MNIYTFVNSRTRNVDYRCLANISPKVCASDFLKLLDYRAQCLTSCYGGGALVKPDHPQWLFMKEGTTVAYGMAGLNVWLDDEYSKDYHKRDIRCFVGIIVTDYDGTAIPFGMNTMKTVFRKVMEPVFNLQYEQSFTDFQLESSTFTDFVSPTQFDTRLNTNIEECHVVSSFSDHRSLIAAALGCDSDVSLFIDIASIKTIEGNGLLPMNALMCDETPEKTFETGLAVPVIEGGEQERNNPNNGEDSKNDDPDPVVPSPYTKWWKFSLLAFIFLLVLTLLEHFLKQPNQDKQDVVQPESKKINKGTDKEKDIYYFHEEEQEQSGRGLKEVKEQQTSVLPDTSQDQKQSKRPPVEHPEK